MLGGEFDPGPNVITIVGESFSTSRDQTARNLTLASVLLDIFCAARISQCYGLSSTLVWYLALSACIDIKALCRLEWYFVGQTVDLRHLSISSMLPHTDDFITYEGSLTQPGCQETVTWILFNKPIYITLRHVGHYGVNSRTTFISSLLL